MTVAEWRLICYFKNGEKTVFIGDSVTDFGRGRPVGDELQNGALRIATKFSRNIGFEKILASVFSAR